MLGLGCHCKFSEAGVLMHLSVTCVVLPFLIVIDGSNLPTV